MLTAKTLIIYNHIQSHADTLKYLVTFSCSWRFPHNVCSAIFNLSITKTPRLEKVRKSVFRKIRKEIKFNIVHVFKFELIV